MGMDVFGREPAGKEGEYFRASVWSWRPIHYLIYDLCSDLFSEETLFRMSMNDGAGPRDQAICTEMALRFEQWLAKNRSGDSIALGFWLTEDGRLVREKERAANPSRKTAYAYSVTKEHLKEWIGFLRSCGGFQVF